MTTIPAGAHLTFGHSRHARRDGAIHRFERSYASSTMRMPWIIVTLGVALMMLALLNVALILIDLV